MKHKLSLTFEPVVAKVAPTSKYANPVGWWKVETEGDCEGRSINNLGEFCGHVAEIAFHLADKCYYTLQFTPVIKPSPANRPKYTTNRKSVWISFGIDSDTWNMTHDVRRIWVEKFLNTDDVEVLAQSPHAAYYAGTYLKLKN